MYRGYKGAQNFLPGKIVEKEGPSSYRIKTQKENIVHRHTDQLVKVMERERKTMM